MKDLYNGVGPTSTLGNVGRPRRANADSPVVVAVIGAGAVIGAAVIAAEASIIVAGIAAGTAIAVTVLSEGGGGEGKRNGGRGAKLLLDPGGLLRTRPSAYSSSTATSRLHHRDVSISTSSLPASIGVGDLEVQALANYRFDGQIARFEPKVKSFNLTDNLILRFTIANIEKAEDAPLILKVDLLRISTVDMSGTEGYSRVRFTAVQDGSVMWRWSAEVNQGEAPKIDGPSAGPEIVRDEKDLLLIRDLKIPIEYKAPGAKTTTVVEIVMNVEGHGARTLGRRIEEQELPERMPTRQRLSGDAGFCRAGGVASWAAVA